MDISSSATAAPAASATARTTDDTCSSLAETYAGLTPRSTQESPQRQPGHRAGCCCASTVPGPLTGTWTN